MYPAFVADALFSGATKHHRSLPLLQHADSDTDREKRSRDHCFSPLGKLICGIEKSYGWRIASSRFWHAYNYWSCYNFLWGNRTTIEDSIFKNKMHRFIYVMILKFFHSSSEWVSEDAFFVGNSINCHMVRGNIEKFSSLTNLQWVCCSLQRALWNIRLRKFKKCTLKVEVSLK